MTPTVAPIIGRWIFPSCVLSWSQYNISSGGSEYSVDSILNVEWKMSCFACRGKGWVINGDSLFFGTKRESRKFSCFIGVVFISNGGYKSTTVSSRCCGGGFPIVLLSGLAEVQLESRAGPVGGIFRAPLSTWLGKEGGVLNRSHPYLNIGGVSDPSLPVTEKSWHFFSWWDRLSMGVDGCRGVLIASTLSTGLCIKSGLICRGWLILGYLDDITAR